MARPGKSARDRGGGGPFPAWPPHPPLITFPAQNFLHDSLSKPSPLPNPKHKVVRWKFSSFPQTLSLTLSHQGIGFFFCASIARRHSGHLPSRSLISQLLIHGIFFSCLSPGQENFPRSLLSLLDSTALRTKDYFLLSIAVHFDNTSSLFRSSFFDSAVLFLSAPSLFSCLFWREQVFFISFAPGDFFFQRRRSQSRHPTIANFISTRFVSHLRIVFNPSSRHSMQVLLPYLF